MGKLKQAEELITIARACGCDAIKFQLFKNIPPNIPIPYEWFPDLVAYGKNLNIEVFASVFDNEALEITSKHCKSIKFAYSQRHAKLHDLPNKINTDIYVSGDVMTAFAPNVIKLYCIPLYPVPYVINFEGIFDRFDGFSSHCLGIYQDIEAVNQGCRIIEKHFTLDRKNIACPDHNFALKPNQLSRLVSKAKSTAKGY